MSEKEHQLDQVDRGILALMQENARISNADIARELNMAPSAVLERIRKLQPMAWVAAVPHRNLQKYLRFRKFIMLPGKIAIW